MALVKELQFAASTMTLEGKRVRHSTALEIWNQAKFFLGTTDVWDNRTLPGESTGKNCVDHLFPVHQSQFHQTQREEVNHLWTHPCHCSPCWPVKSHHIETKFTSIQFQDNYYKERYVIIISIPVVYAEPVFPVLGSKVRWPGKNWLLQWSEISSYLIKKIMP